MGKVLIAPVIIYYHLMMTLGCKEFVYFYIRHFNDKVIYTGRTLKHTHTHVHVYIHVRDQN